MDNLVCEMWAIRTLAVELLADKLAGFQDVRKAADQISKAVYSAYNVSFFIRAFAVEVTGVCRLDRGRCDKGGIKPRRTLGGGG